MQKSDLSFVERPGQWKYVSLQVGLVPADEIASNHLNTTYEGLKNELQFSIQEMIAEGTVACSGSIYK